MKSGMLLTTLSLSVLFIIPEEISGQDECAPLFFTPAWQDCLVKRIQASIINPANIPMAAQPNLFGNNPLGGFGNFASSSSSSSSTSGGTSTSVLSSNGRTWTVKSEGLPISTSDSGKSRNVKIFIGKPSSLDTIKDDAGNSLQVNLAYPDGSKKWVSLQLSSPTRVAELLVNRRDDMLYIEGPM